MMQQIIKKWAFSEKLEVFMPNEFLCGLYSQMILIIRPSTTKIRIVPLTFLERIQGDMAYSTTI